MFSAGCPAMSCLLQGTAMLAHCSLIQKPRQTCTSKPRHHGLENSCALQNTDNSNYATPTSVDEQSHITRPTLETHLEIFRSIDNSGRQTRSVCFDCLSTNTYLIDTIYMADFEDQNYRDVQALTDSILDLISSSIPPEPMHHAHKKFATCSTSNLNTMVD